MPKKQPLSVIAFPPLPDDPCAVDAGVRDPAVAIEVLQNAANFLLERPEVATRNPRLLAGFEARIARLTERLNDREIRKELVAIEARQRRQAQWLFRVRQEEGLAAQAPDFAGREERRMTRQSARRRDLRALLVRRSLVGELATCGRAVADLRAAFEAFRREVDGPAPA